MARQAKAPLPSPLVNTAASLARAEAYRQHPQLVKLAEGLINLHHWEPARDLMGSPDAAQLIRLMDYYTQTKEERTA